MHSLRTRGAASILLAVVLHAAGDAKADVRPRSAEDVARAEARFHAGEAYFDAKQYDAACAAFDESERLDPQLGTLLNLAFCHERLGKTATAWREYGIGAIWAEQRGQHDRAAWALGRAVEVSRRVPVVLLELPAGAERYTIEVDGSVLAPSQWGAPIPVDPGAHDVRVSGRGLRGQQLALQVPEGPATQALTIPLLAPGAESAPPVYVGETSRPAPRGSSTRLVVGLAGVGVGVAGLGVGTYFGLRTFSKKDDASPHCVGSECDATGVALQDDAHHSATASTVAFVVGGTSLLLGAWLALTSGAPSSSTSRAGLHPVIGPGVAGLGGAW